MRYTAVVMLAALGVAGCATKGALRRAVNEQRELVNAERAERIAGDSALQGQVNAVRTDVEALRRDLQGMRTEFGAKITALEEGVQFALPVHFAFDDATVRPEDEAALERFATVVQRYYAGSKVTIEGFADPAGSRAYNRALSERRAAAVRSYLSDRGVAENLLYTVGYGEDRQVVPGAERDDPGAEQNRRVVFVIESGGATSATVAALSLPEGK